MNGVFAIEKPSGVTSLSFILDLQRLFTNSGVFAKDLALAKQRIQKDLSSDKKWLEARIKKKVRDTKVKIGHGGTLDPLAQGVLVVGVGSGTKKLQYYLSECTKTYETKALLGISTTTGDSEGEIITQNPVGHITKEDVAKTAKKFVGDLTQTPPIFSALKMNGKALYDYAREGIPLPAPIKPRKVKVASIEIHGENSLSVDHGFTKLESQLDENGIPKEHNLANNPTLNDAPLYFSDQFMAEAEDGEKKTDKPALLPAGESLPEKLPLLHMTADVSSGTYIRSLVSDFGRALGSAAYMVELIRVKQSDWDLHKNTFKMDDFTKRDEAVWGKVLGRVIEEGSSVELKSAFDEAEKEFAESASAAKAVEEAESETLEKEEGSAKEDAQEDTHNSAKNSELPKKRNIEEVE